MVSAKRFTRVHEALIRAHEAFTRVHEAFTIGYKTIILRRKYDMVNYSRR